MAKRDTFRIWAFGSVTDLASQGNTEAESLLLFSGLAEEARLILLSEERVIRRL